jgi:hypothetical protein
MSREYASQERKKTILIKNRRASCSSFRYGIKSGSNRREEGGRENTRIGNNNQQNMQKSEKDSIQQLSRNTFFLPPLFKHGIPVLPDNNSYSVPSNYSLSPATPSQKIHAQAGSEESTKRGLT